MGKLIIACWRLANPDGASDRAVEWICGEGGSEIADAEASSTMNCQTLRWRGPCRHLHTTVLPQESCGS